MITADLKKAPPYLVQHRAIDREPWLDGRSGKHGRYTVAELLAPGWLTTDKFGSRLEVDEVLDVAGTDGDVRVRCIGVDRDGCFVLRPFMAAPIAGPSTVPSGMTAPDHEPAETPAARGARTRSAA